MEWGGGPRSGGGVSSAEPSSPSVSSAARPIHLPMSWGGETNGEPEMKSIAFAAAAAAAVLAAPALAQEAPTWSLAIHGGAGVIERAQLSPERDAAYRAGLQ